MTPHKPIRRLSSCLPVRPAHDDPEPIVRQRSLQRFSLIPGRAHPYVTLFIVGQDHRHRLGMDRLDNRIRCRGQKSVDQVRAEDRLGLCAAVAFEFGPDAGEGE